MKPVDPRVYRAALDRIDVFKKALRKIAEYKDIDICSVKDIANEALATAADADMWDSGTMLVKLKADDDCLVGLAAAITPSAETCACGHGNEYHFADGRGDIRCRATKECNCGLTAVSLALSGMIGLIQLFSQNPDIPGEVRDAMIRNHRFKDALACFPDTNWSEYGLTPAETGTEP